MSEQKNMSEQTLKDEVLKEDKKFYNNLNALPKHSAGFKYLAIQKMVGEMLDDFENEVTRVKKALGPTYTGKITKDKLKRIQEFL